MAGRQYGRKTQEQRRLRVYEQWLGNERFFCWGYCVTGPSWKSGMGSLVLLVAPTIVFLVFVVPYMAREISPVFWIVSCILPVFCASMLLLTSCRDPGILPRQEPDEEWLQARKPRTKEVNVNGHRVTVRYNDTCHFYQPPRAHHCSVNDNCIERFDHHCPWVGTTIGKRNYRTFLLFIYSTSVYIAWTFGVSLASLFVKHAELEAAAAAKPPPQSADSLSSNLWLQTLGQSGGALALMIFTFIFFWFVGGLSCFHTWLVATNQTTYENFRYNHNQVPNPYSEGLLRNCASVWCVRIPPSKVQFRAFLDEVVREPVELGYTEWAPPVASTPSRTDTYMSPMGGAAPQGIQTSGEWPGQYGGADAQQQYITANGSGEAYAARAAPGQINAAGGRFPAGGMHAAAAAGAAGQQVPPAAAGHTQSFDSIPDSCAELPVSRHATQGYSSSSPPPLGPMYSNNAPGPLSAGLAAVQIPQGDSSAGSSPYYTPQQGLPVAPGPLTSSLQQQQLREQVQQQQHHHQQQQQQWRTAGIELPSAVGAKQGGWHQQQQGGPLHSAAAGRSSPGPGNAPVSQQQIRIDMPAAHHSHVGS